MDALHQAVLSVLVLCVKGCLRVEDYKVVTRRRRRELCDVNQAVVYSLEFNHLGRCRISVAVRKNVWSLTELANPILLSCSESSGVAEGCITTA